jgi:hypothetical protein
MSDAGHPPSSPSGKPLQPPAEEAPARGANLLLLYGLLALALAAAIGFALLIVQPFYHRR